MVERSAADAGNGAIALTCDVRDLSSCELAVATAVEEFGGLDAIIYTVAKDTMDRLRSADEDAWADSLATNVVGASLATAAAIEQLEASGGRAIYFSSSSGPTSAPWPGLGVYGVTKAALERLIDAWQAEHPLVAFSSLILGPTLGDNDAPSQFGTTWDADLAAEFLPKWIEIERHPGLVTSEDLIQGVSTILTVDALISSMTILPRS